MANWIKIDGVKYFEIGLSDPDETWQEEIGQTMELFFKFEVQKQDLNDIISTYYAHLNYWYQFSNENELKYRQKIITHFGENISLQPAIYDMDTISIDPELNDIEKILVTETSKKFIKGSFDHFSGKGEIFLDMKDPFIDPQDLISGFFDYSDDLSEEELWKYEAMSNEEFLEAGILIGSKISLHPIYEVLFINNESNKQYINEYLEAIEELNQMYKSIGFKKLIKIQSKK